MVDRSISEGEGPEMAAPPLAGEDRIPRLSAELSALRTLAETGEVFTTPRGGDESGSRMPRPFGLPFHIHEE